MAQQRRHAIRRRAGFIGQKNDPVSAVRLMQRVAQHAAQHIAAEITPVVDRPTLRQRPKLFLQTIQHLLRQFVMTGNHPT